MASNDCGRKCTTSVHETDLTILSSRRTGDGSSARSLLVCQYASRTKSYADEYAEYTRVWVSEVIPSRSQDPTVIQCLFYWFASALGFPRSWKTPKVSDEISGNISRSPSTFRSVCLRQNGLLDRQALNALNGWP